MHCLASGKVCSQAKLLPLMNPPMQLVVLIKGDSQTNGCRDIIVLSLSETHARHNYKSLLGCTKTHFTGCFVVFSGCSADVLFHADSVCSGRRSCSFVVPDATLRGMKPCPKDFALYFQAKHSCVKGEHIAPGSSSRKGTNEDLNCRAEQKGVFLGGGC